MFDFNRFSKHNVIGELRLPLCNVDWNHVIEEWQDLTEPPKFEVVQTNITQRLALANKSCCFKLSKNNNLATRVWLTKLSG